MDEHSQDARPLGPSLVRRRLQVLAMILTLVVLVNATGACTFVGLGVGSYSRATTPIASLDQAARGDTITVVLETGQELTGRFDGVIGDSVYLGRASAEEAIPLSRVKSFSVVTGSHWATGMLIGAVVDAMMVGYAVNYVNTHQGAY